MSTEPDPWAVRAFDDTEVTLRPITAEDEPLLLELYASTREDELRLVPWSEEQKREFVIMQFYSQMRAYFENYPRQDYSIIVVRGEPVGRLYVSRMATEIRLVDIVVGAAFRGRGLGTLLLSGLIGESEVAGMPLTMHVERENPALRWYERLGFEVAGDVGTHYFMRRPPCPSK